MDKNIYKFLIFVLLLPFFLGGSCEKRKFSFVANVNQIVTYEDIITENRIVKSLSVSTLDIKKNLDIPEDGEVTEVFIKGFSIKIDPTSANTAENIYSTVTITGTNGLRKILWENKGTSTTYASRSQHINDLLEEGVSELKTILEEALLVNKNTIYTLGLEVDPGIDKFAADVEISMEVQVEYKQCVEVWDYLDAGEDCS